MTTAAVPADRHYITAWSAVSPYGVHSADYARGIQADATHDTDTGDDTLGTGTGDATLGTGAGVSQSGSRATGRIRSVPVPEGHAGEQACLVPGFEVRQVLGKAGTRTMDRATGLAVTAVRELFDEASREQRPVPVGTGTGLVLGTTLGSAQSQHDFALASFTEDKPYDVPAQFMPNVLMNCPAAASAIRFGLKGPNTTLAGGRPTGLIALGYARRLLAAGRAERVLVGAVEDYSPSRSWIEHHVRDADETPGPLGEGCALLLIEPGDGIPEGRTALAELLAVDVRVDVDDALAGTAEACVRDALTAAGVDPSEVWAAVGGGLTGRIGHIENALLKRLFGTEAATRVTVHDRIGDTAAASAAFQLAALLATARRTPAAHGRAAVVTSVDRDGSVACAVIRLLGEAEER
ncbi:MULTISPECIES: beta-ketoacyl synthase N-terminal-like domain-containing protein [unclassified Streptomyces]|uniref:beta-ketoacyl synthase N-terminal-like domain-containing protein n=1 Tax=unclassified Streptomyces TaxID=2593676 RepID=UPI0037FB038F